MITTSGLLRFCAGVLFITGVGWTFVNLRTVYRNANKPLTEPEAVVTDWRSYGTSGQRLGPADAKVTLVVFSDYECGTCGYAHRALVNLRRRYPDSFAVVIRHYPLPRHVMAATAARAAVCAAAQGQFDRFNEVLWTGADSLGTKAWTRYALEAGLSDTLRFRTCLSAPSTVATVAADMAAGLRLRVSVTPTMLINEALYGGIPADLERIVAHGMKADVALAQKARE